MLAFSQIKVLTLFTKLVFQFT